MKYVWIETENIRYGSLLHKIPSVAHVLDDDGNYKQFDLLEKPTALWEHLKGELAMFHGSFEKDYVKVNCEKYNIESIDNFEDFLRTLIEKNFSVKNGTCEPKEEYTFTRHVKINHEPWMIRYKWSTLLFPLEKAREGLLDGEETAYYYWYLYKSLPKYPIHVLIEYNYKDDYIYQIFEVWFDGKWHYREWQPSEEEVKKLPKNFRENKNAILDYFSTYIKIHEKKITQMKYMCHRKEKEGMESITTLYINAFTQKQPHIYLLEDMLPNLDERAIFSDMESISFKALWKNREEVVKYLELLMEKTEGVEIYIGASESDETGKIRVGVDIPIVDGKREYSEISSRRKRQEKRIRNIIKTIGVTQRKKISSGEQGSDENV